MLEEFTNKKARELFIQSLKITNDAIIRGEEEQRKYKSISDDTLQMHKEAKD